MFSNSKHSVLKFHSKFTGRTGLGKTQASAYHVVGLTNLICDKNLCVKGNHFPAPQPFGHLALIISSFTFVPLSVFAPVWSKNS